MKTDLSRLDESSRRAFMCRAAQAFLGVGLLSVGRQHGLAAVPTQAGGSAKHVIYLYMSGGMSHIDTFDPKDRVAEAGPVRPIATSVDDVFLSEYLPLTAERMHHLAVVRSITSTQGAHEQGNYFMHTSYTMRGTIKHPGMGAWLEVFQGRGNETLPGHVVIGNASRHPGAGFFDPKFSPLMLNNPERGLSDSRMARGTTPETFDYRLDLASRLDREFRERYQYRGVQAYTDLYKDAVTMMRSEDLKAFDIDQERNSTRSAYGTNAFGQGCLLARRLVEHGVKFIEVNMGGWDTHVSNFTRTPELCQTFDRAYTALLDDLESRGLLDDTMVVVATEFGRTPGINQNDGRDHYPRAFSGVLAGGGVRGGTVYGQTDPRGRDIEHGRLEIPDFNATIAHGLGLPLDHVLYSPSKRPFTVAHRGRPALEVFA